MAVLVDITGYVYGIPCQSALEDPIASLPTGAKKVRWKYRCDDLVRAYIRTESVVIEVIPIHKDGVWHLDPMQGALLQGINIIEYDIWCEAPAKLLKP